MILTAAILAGIAALFGLGAEAREGLERRRFRNRAEAKLAELK